MQVLCIHTTGNSVCTFRTPFRVYQIHLFFRRGTKVYILLLLQPNLCVDLRRCGRINMKSLQLPCSCLHFRTSCGMARIVARIINCRHTFGRGLVEECGSLIMGLL